MSQLQPVRRKMQISKQQTDEKSVSIPDKLYFRIGDVAQLCSLQAYVLRYWETEFPQLKPHKGGTGQRLYRKRDVELVLEIKRLLYKEGFTIAGARRLLSEKHRPETDESQTKEIDATTAEVSGIPQHSGVPDVLGFAENKSGASGAWAKKPNADQAELVKQPPIVLGPRLSDLRREMHDLLSLLQKASPEHAPAPTPAKRESKKTHTDREEPTLFS